MGQKKRERPVPRTSDVVDTNSRGPEKEPGAYNGTATDDRRRSKQARRNQDVSTGRSGDVPKGRQNQKAEIQGQTESAGKLSAGRRASIITGRAWIQTRATEQRPREETRHRRSLDSGKSRNLLKAREEVPAEPAKRVTDRELNTERLSHEVGLLNFRCAQPCPERPAPARLAPQAGPGPGPTSQLSGH